MFEQHELYTRLNRRDRPFVKGLRSHDNMGIYHNLLNDINLLPRPNLFKIYINTRD